MNRFLFLPLSLKSLVLIIPFCLFGSSSCDADREIIESFHPIWRFLNDPEDKLPKDKAIVTKFGWGRLRFHVTDGQRCLNSASDGDGLLSKDKNNIIEISSESKPIDSESKPIYVVLTPNVYGIITEETFPKTMAAGIKYQYDGKTNGMPLPFLEEWLAIDDDKEAILIISTGVDGRLGVNKVLEDALKKKKEEGKIQDYKIQRSLAAVNTHNRYVKEGKKVFTFIHTVG